MKKVRNISWHTVLIDTLKPEKSNFVLNPSLHWKPVECSQQCCCTCMPGLTKNVPVTARNELTSMEGVCSNPCRSTGLCAMQ